MRRTRSSASHSFPAPSAIPTRPTCGRARATRPALPIRSRQHVREPHARGLGTVRDAQLAIDAGQMELDRLLGNVKIAGYRGVRLPLGDEAQDARLARRQRVKRRAHYAGGYAPPDRAVSPARLAFPHTNGVASP